MLVVVMPFALVRVFDASSRRSWWLNAIAFALMLVAAAATDGRRRCWFRSRCVIYLACYRPRQVLRLAPSGSSCSWASCTSPRPGALGTIFTPTRGSPAAPPTHRLGDFTDVAPDVFAHPVLGRGFGTLNPEQPDQFRINDDEYIDEIWEVGAVGLLAYLCMILAPIAPRPPRDPCARSHRRVARARRVGRLRRLLVVNALFDAMSFPQAPYMFFMVAALTTIAAAGPAGDVVPARELARRLPLARRELAGAHSPP